MAARVTLKAVNDELARRGHHARLEKASGYFYFWSEDSAGWIDRTVRVPRLNSLTLDQWVGEYLWLKKINAEMTKPNRVRPWVNPDSSRCMRAIRYRIQRSLPWRHGIQYAGRLEEAANAYLGSHSSSCRDDYRNFV